MHYVKHCALALQRTDKVIELFNFEFTVRRRVIVITSPLERIQLINSSLCFMQCCLNIGDWLLNL